MAKKKKSKGFFRVKDLATGLYYNKRAIWMYDESGKYNGHTHWDEYGSIWNSRGPAESQVTALTKTFKHNRDTEAKMILYGSKETYNIRVVEADIQDKK